MNTTLETVIGRIASLPDDEQQRFADWLVAELDDEARWQAKFAASIPLLEKMSDEALAEHQRGETKPFPGLED